MSKTIVIIFLSLILILTVWSIIYREFIDKGERELSSYSNKVDDLPPLPPEEERSKLTFDKNYLDNFDHLVAGFEPGKRVPEIEFVSYTGESLNLPEAGQKMLLYFDVENCESCLGFYSILTEWAVKYGEQLHTMIFFKNEAREGFEQDLIKAGIQLIPNASEIIEKFNATYSIVYLVDTSGKVVHYFDFDFREWEKFDRLVDEFVRFEKIPHNINKSSYIQKGEVVPEIEFGSDVYDQNKLNSSEFIGKPTLIFMSDQVCRFCDTLYPLINELDGRFKERVNIILLLSSLRNNQSYAEVKEFYARYNLELPRIYEETFTDNPELDFVNSQGLEVAVYTALEKAQSRWGISAIPSLLILNEKGEVERFLQFDSRKGDEFIDAEKFLIEEVSKIIK